MKLVLSALLVVLALSQAAEAKKKIPMCGNSAAKAEETRPPLDNTSTGGIAVPADAKAATDGSQYPPALYLNFQ